MEGDPSSLMAPAVQPDPSTAPVPQALHSRSAASAERAIRVTPGPGRDRRLAIASTLVNDNDRPTSSGSSRSHGETSATDVAGVRVRGNVSRTEGIVAKFIDWVDSSTHSGSGRVRGMTGPGRGNGADGDFTSFMEDPDRRRMLRDKKQQQQPQSRRETLEQQWRRECLAAASARDLSEVAESRIMYYAPHLVHRQGYAVVVVVGGHYRSGLVDREELLLHCVKEMEKVNGREFVVLYFNASAPLSLVPDTVFFAELHAALHPAHRQLLHGIYVVHPGAVLRSWAFVLRLQDPAVYGKIAYVPEVRDLLNHFHPDVMQELPDLVRDKDSRVTGRRAA